MSNTENSMNIDEEIATLFKKHGMTEKYEIKEHWDISTPMKQSKKCGGLDLRCQRKERNKIKNL